MSIRLSDYAKTDEGVNCQIPKRIETKAIANTDYTVDPETDYNLIVAATTSNVDISLPLK